MKEKMAKAAGEDAVERMGGEGPVLRCSSCQACHQVSTAERRALGGGREHTEKRKGRSKGLQSGSAARQLTITWALSSPLRSSQGALTALLSADELPTGQPTAPSSPYHCLPPAFLSLLLFSQPDKWCCLALSIHSGTGPEVPEWWASSPLQSKSKRELLSL